MFARFRWVATVVLGGALASLACSSAGSDDGVDEEEVGADLSVPLDAEDDSTEVVDDVAADALDTAAIDASSIDAPLAEVEASVPCKSVAHVGDSLTAYTIDPLAMAYAKVGVTAQIDAYGGRAILQKLAADPKTGRQAALDYVKAGFKGCWVVALGTNDTANVAVGASYTRAHAIDEMMNAIDPSANVHVMWVNAFTTKTTGSWSIENMKLWNEALEKARSRWPNLKIFDWASIAATGIAPYSDGIHHTKAGYAARNKAIADALVGFFSST